MHVITGNRLHIKCWANDLEKKAVAQACNLAKLPFAYDHIALMPDAHSGYGMPIGGILATKDVIVPNAVGVDIGCEMREKAILLFTAKKRTLPKNAAPHIKI